MQTPLPGRVAAVAVSYENCRIQSAIEVMESFRGTETRGFRSAFTLLIITFGSMLCLSQQGSRDTIPLQSATTLLRSRQFPAAVEAYHKILKADPHNEKAELGLAAAYYGVYNYDETRRVLRAAAAAHPNSASALVEIGKLDIHLLHYDDAIVELKRAVRRNPASAAAREQLGVAYQAKGDEDAALAEFNQALRLAPDSASAHYFRGTLYADRDDNNRAYEEAKEAFRLEPNTQTRELLGKTAVRANRCKEAADVLAPLADSGETNPEDLYLLSRAYKCADQPQRAQEVQEEYEKRSKKVQDAKTHKMNADHLAANAGEMARKNQLAPALDLLQQALAEDPENGPSLAQLAKIDFSRGDVSKAQQEIAQALRGDPYNPDYLYVQGKVLEGIDPRAALEAFRQTVLVNPKESDAYYEMGEIYLKLGDRNQATHALRKAVQLSPEDPEYRKALSELQARPER
jgi:tetratricopeptide (TPR) repeat protein